MTGASARVTRGGAGRRIHGCIAARQTWGQSGLVNSSDEPRLALQPAVPTRRVDASSSRAPPLRDAFGQTVVNGATCGGGALVVEAGTPCPLVLSVVELLWAWRRSCLSHKRLLLRPRYVELEELVAACIA